MNFFQITASAIGKKFAHEWIFRNFTQTFALNQVYVITGNNGSGKSTLLKSLAGMQPISQGTLGYVRGKMQVPSSWWYQQLSYVAPYLQLIDEFTLQEMIDFQAQFKQMLYTRDELIEKIALPKAHTKPIKHFSSGMKQKCKLALALYTTAPALFLDEPTSNFDKNNLLWYQEQLLKLDRTQKTIILASNEPKEYDFLDDRTELQMTTYK